MNLEQALNYIHGLYRKGVAPSLHRVEQLLALLGNPHKKLKFIHIAGTNGKGSTAAMTSSILQTAGYKTGLFTSPFIYRFNERIQINGMQIPDEQVIALTQRLSALTGQMSEMPTEFDFVTSMAMEYFSAQGCDIVVLEVGVGGALDATNMIPAPEVAVITNIGLDHTDLLGDTVEKIAAVKGGIIKAGTSAVIYRSSPSVEQVLRNICLEKNAQLHFADFDSIHLHSHDLSGQHFDCGQRKLLELPLLGAHQLKNAAVVLSVIDTLQQKGWGITEQHIREGLKNVTWPGRFDIMHKDPLFIIDGGHNPQCIDAMVANIQDYLAGKTLIVLTGVLADKDYGEMFRPVMPYVQKFVCITPDNPRKLEAQELAAHLQAAGAEAEAFAKVADGVRRAMALAGKDGVVLCFGSLYSIADIRTGLQQVLAQTGIHI